MENNMEHTLGNPTPCVAQEKTFTQEEVNRIVQERLARVKTTPNEAEVDLQRRETDVYIREQILNHKLPSDSQESLKGLNRETIDKVIEIIAPYIKKASEPILNPVGPTGGVITGSDPIREAMGLNHK